jgi:hypothetical protein
VVANKKQMEDKLIVEKKKMNEKRVQQFKKQDMVFVQEKDDLTVDAVNKFSLQNAISRKDLDGLNEKIKSLEEAAVQDKG